MEKKKTFCSSQHRERIIIVGFDNECFKGKKPFKFPEMSEAKSALKDILCLRLIVNIHYLINGIIYKKVC
jgi:site-specific DNA-cytosine methylase